jgi:hypothetical protein
VPPPERYFVGIMKSAALPPNNAIRFMEKSTTEDFVGCAVAALVEREVVFSGRTNTVSGWENVEADCQVRDRWWK